MPDLQQPLTYFQLLDYAIGIQIIGVVYDYFLTFSREVEYIWLKPWTWVSTLFVLIRYLGIIQALLLVITNSSSFPTTVSVSTIVSQVNEWIFLVYLAAVDLGMILRIYAMWGRSKTILGFCLFIYLSNTIIGFVFAAIFDNPDTYMSVTIESFLDTKACSVSINFPLPIWVYLSPGYPVSAALLILPLIQTCKESFNMYKATKKWQPNQYMSLLVRDGIAYFVIRSSYDIQWGINYGINRPFNFAAPFTNLLSLMLMFSMLPRFIIGIRELYDHDTHRLGVDTGFGISSPFVAANSVTPSGIRFADDDDNSRIGDPSMTSVVV